MRNELVTIHLLKASANVRLFLSQLMGPSVTTGSLDILSHLGRVEILERLTAKFQCPPEYVFEKVASRAKRDVQARSPRRLTGTHLHQLMGMTTRKRLARILNCATEDVLDCLFDVSAIVATIFPVDPLATKQLLAANPHRDSFLPSAETLFLAVFTMFARVEKHYQISETNWGNLLDEHRWLNATALVALRRYAAERGGDQAAGASMLATSIEMQAGDEIRDSVCLDTLAVIAVRRRIAWIIQQLRDQAQELSIRASALAPDDPALHCLQQHITFYELSAPAQAWRGMLDLKAAKPPTIKEQISGFNIRSTGRPGTPKRPCSLKTRTEPVYSIVPRWQPWKRRSVIGTDLTVSCEVEETTQAVDILVLRDVPQKDIAWLSQFFTSLHDPVAGRGWVEDIGAQLLGATLRSSDTFRDAVVSAAAELESQLIPALVLTGLDLPGNLPATWDERITRRLPITSGDRVSDSVFPKKRIDILNEIRAEYQQNKNVQIVE